MLKFNPEDHTYWNEGQQVPGVNEIFKSLGLIDTTFMTEEGAARGKRRHLLLEQYDDDSLVWDDVLPEDLHILTGWQEFKTDMGLTVLGQELPVFHERMHYAGTPDKIMQGTGEPWIIDIKTSASSYPWHRLQTALYRLAYSSAFGLPIPRGGCVYLREAKKKQYRWVPHEEPYLLDSAFAVVEAYHWQQGNKEWIEDMHQSKLDWLDVLAQKLGEVV